jgi:peptidoglycan/LPS O-acetylase OafA/YrhL
LNQKDNFQIPVINTLRGLAASLVCFYHFVCTTINFISNKTVVNVFHYGEKGVQIFFIISGIVIPLSMIAGHYKYSSFLKFIARRFVRIEPPFLVSLLIGIAYLTLRNYIPGSAQADLTPSVKEVVLHIGYLIPFFEGTHWVNPPYWTLAVEFQYYLFLALAFPLVLNSKIILRCIFYILIIIPSFFYFTPAFFPHWGIYFLLGILYILYKKELIKIAEYWVMTLIAAGLVFYFLGVTDLIVAAFTLSVIHFFPNLESAAGRFLGKVSYSLYLLHSIIGSAFVNFMSHRVSGSFQKILVVLGGFALSVFSAWLMYLIIEKPSQNLAKKIKY